MSILLSEKHGVNPCLPICWICGEDTGEEGVFLIEVRDGESGNNPHRTGRRWAITAEAANRLLCGDAGRAALQKRIAFIEKTTATALGLPEPA